MSLVTHVPAADAELAQQHYARLLAFETDCWDVHHAMTQGRQDFILLDVRSERAWAEAHIPGAHSLPHPRINADSLAKYGPDTIFVVYCNGPHCNGADKAALRLARLGRPVKKMIGGVRGWLDEGFHLTEQKQWWHKWLPSQALPGRVSWSD